MLEGGIVGWGEDHFKHFDSRVASEAPYPRSVPFACSETWPVSKDVTQDREVSCSVWVFYEAYVNVVTTASPPPIFAVWTFGTSGEVPPPSKRPAQQ